MQEILLLRGDELYLPGTIFDLQFQAEGSSSFGPLAATVIKCFEPFTSAALLLVLRISDNEKAILNWRIVDWDIAVVKVDQCRGPLPSKIICNMSYAKFKRAWRTTGLDAGGLHLTLQAVEHNTELAAYRLLLRLQGQYIPRHFGIVRLRITPESTTLHPITDIVQGCVFEYALGVSMAKLKADVDVSEEAESTSSQAMEALRAIEAENCVLHIIIDFGQADIREPGLSDEEWLSVVGASPDTHRMRNLLVNPEDARPWKRIVMPYEMSDPYYKDPPMVFNEYVESMPEDFRRGDV
ncbi:hypothetical protein EDD85DRAFT_1026995 [Armillaria nabsnona]|nr:hypothetical protein EDD85DRAFT_1026995 [Armillaria nabsnona]